MKVKVKDIEKSIKREDSTIILNEPIEIIKYGRKFVFKPILWKNWDKFSYHMGCFVRYYYVVCGFSSLPENLNELEEFSNNIKSAIVRGKDAFKHFVKLLKISKLNVRFIKKNFTMDDMAEFFVYMYLVNIKSVKKNFKIAQKQLMGI
jgi:hypothetical protein